MKLRSIGLVGGFVLVCVGVYAAMRVNSRSSPASLPDDPAGFSTPPGITLQPLGLAQGYGLDKKTATALPRNEVVYADADGMTLYEYDGGSKEEAACLSDCAKLWAPARPSVSAKAFGDWTVITRPDGVKQWALRGHPLYRYSKDEDIGSVGGNSPKRFGRGPAVGPRGAPIGPIAEDVPMPEGWKAAHFYPWALEPIPPDFAIREIDDAAGLVLVYEGAAAYAFSGDPNSDNCSVTCDWRPIEAPALADKIGAFGSVARTDGIRQWTYRKHPLYSYLRDLTPSDVNGDGVDPRWRVAYVSRDFMPTEVRIQKNPMLGKILTTAQGKTLYRRDSFILQTGSGHALRHGSPVRPAVGRDIGMMSRCVKDCDRWHPFLAPADAQPQGYWSILIRQDGNKQWVYQGYALWTYDGDHDPGDIKANDDYDILVGDDAATVIDIGTPYDGVPALYWAAAIP